MVLKNLAPLRAMPLQKLSLQHASVKDYSPLQDLSITMLTLGKTTIKDLDFLENMPLETLDLRNSTVINITALQSIHSLKYLYFNPRNVGTNWEESIKALSNIKVLATSYSEESSQQSPAQFWINYNKGKYKKTNKLWDYQILVRAL